MAEKKFETLEVGTKFGLVLKLVRECVCAPKSKTKGEEIISAIIIYLLCCGVN